MRIKIPDFGIVAMIGPSGSGKSHFARKHFLPTEILESDFFRAMVSDDRLDQASTEAAFACLYQVAEKRLDNRKLIVLDATNLSGLARKQLLDFARQNNVPVSAIVLNMGMDICKKQNAQRPEKVPESVIYRQCGELRHLLNNLEKEGFDHIYLLNSPEEADMAEIDRVPLLPDKRHLHGPFDIIGDIHGCFAEACELLDRLGYLVDAENLSAIPPKGRTAIFLGDLGDRGPDSIKVFKLVMNMEKAGFAMCLPGNHEYKLLRYLEGLPIRIGKGIRETIEKLRNEPPEFVEELKIFLQGRISHFILDDGKLVCSHAGLPEKLQGRISPKVRDFCIFGSSTGEKDEYGLPVRPDWVKNYRGKSLAVFGHYPKANVKFYNNTIDLDSGCVFGGELSSLRYPELELVSVKAHEIYKATSHPILPVREAPYLNIKDVLDKRVVKTSLVPAITIPEGGVMAALEKVNHFCLPPASLMYLPPVEISRKTDFHEDCPERPEYAFAYYKKAGISGVVCVERHMGARGVIIVTNSGQANADMGLMPESNGVIYNRSGGTFFGNEYSPYEQEILNSLKQSLSANNFWEKYRTDWICLDCEIMPLFLDRENQSKNHSAIFTNARLFEVNATLNKLAAYKVKLAEEERHNLNNLLGRLKSEKKDLEKYQKALASLCHPVNSWKDIRISPLNIMATSGHVWSDIDNKEQSAIIKESLEGWANFIPARHIVLDLSDEKSLARGIDFWEQILSEGGMGMAVKSREIISWINGELVQPEFICRSGEYLRLGMDNSGRGREIESGSSSAMKRALEEFALGQEALSRFVSGKPSYLVHECVYAILALESEYTDISSWPEIKI